MAERYWLFPANTSVRNGWDWTARSIMMWGHSGNCPYIEFMPTFRLGIEIYTRSRTPGRADDADFLGSWLQTCLISFLFWRRDTRLFPCSWQNRILVYLEQGRDVGTQLPVAAGCVIADPLL